MIQQSFSQRGKPSAIYVGYKTLRRMGIWDIDKVKTTRGDTTRGITNVGTYSSLAGDLDVVLIPGDALNDLIFVVDESRIGYKAYNNRGWFTKKLAENGDSSKWQVAGEYTTKVSTPLVHCYGYGLGL